jgi:hypothetical protein
VLPTQAFGDSSSIAIGSQDPQHAHPIDPLMLGDTSPKARYRDEAISKTSH